MIELTDGVYTGKDNAGLWFPTHPLMLISEGWGTSRLATVIYEGSLAAFYISDCQDNRTIIRGLNLRLNGVTAYQIGFWMGDSNIIAPGKGAAPIFEGVSVLLGDSDVNVGFFCRHSVPDTIRFENCVVRGRRGVSRPLRGIYAIDSPALSLVNCTFQDFSAKPYSYGIQFESTHGNYGGAASPVNVSMVNCLWDESFAHAAVEAFVRLEQSIAYSVSLTNCLVPRELNWFPPNACSGLLITNAHLALGGHLRSSSPAIDAGFAANTTLRDFEGQLRDTLPDIGADERMGFPAGQDSDSDGISDSDEVDMYGTNPYDPDSDGDSVSDADELAAGTDPIDSSSVDRPVTVTVVNRFSSTLTNIVSYALDNTTAMGEHIVTQFMGNATLSFPFSFRPSTNIWIKAACDMNCDGVIDPAIEPVYQVPFHTILPGVKIEINDFDGDGLINLHEYYSGTNPGVHDVHPASNALLNATLAIDSRIAGKDPATALSIFLDYIANGNNGIFIRNPDCWAADIDLTCCSPWNSQPQRGKNERAGTLISPRHVLFCGHFPVSVGTKLKFVDKNNVVIQRTAIATKKHPAYNDKSITIYADLFVALLDSDVSTNQISFAKVLPDNFRQYFRDGKRLPALRLDQEEKALVGDMFSVSSDYTALAGGLTSCMVPLDTTRKNFFETIIDGDSGNPLFLIIYNQPVLLTVWTSGGAGSGSSVVAFKQDINQIMLQLEMQNGCTNGYQLTEIGLSGFQAIQ